MAKIKNSLIQAMVNRGLANTTNHDIPVKDAYKAFRFKAGVEKAYEGLEEKRKGLAKEAGIEDAETFDARKAELEAMPSRDEKQQKELDEMTGKFEKFQELWKELMDDETEVEGIKTMSFESFHALSRENRQTNVLMATGEKGKDGRPKTVTVPVDFFQTFIGELEGILWKAPEEEE